jgi:RNA 2',3'-cyclic 3'-phosphodiesterase
LARSARRVPDYNLHLTLHFIGNVDLEAADCMRRSARAVKGKAFDLCIDGAGCFARARVGWLGTSMVPGSLQALHLSLGGELRQCGFTPETRAFHPHVTVARKLARMPAVEAFEPLQWKVDNFALVESCPCDGGVRYEVRESYPLR